MSDSVVSLGQPEIEGVRKSRKNNPEKTREDILQAAINEFVQQGLAGARVDAIAERTATSKRMIYYYFGSKEGLYIAVLEDLYRRFNEAEAALKFNVDKPEEALVAVVSFIWDYYHRNPDFITLLNDENLHRGKHISKSLRAREYSSPAIQILESVLASGVQQKVFRSGLSARDVYLMIAGLNYFYLSNRYTLSAFLGEKLEQHDAMAHWQQFVIDTVLRTVKP